MIASTVSANCLRFGLLLLTGIFGSCTQRTYADLYFSLIWGRSGSVQIAGSEPLRWVLATTDTDDDVLFTSTNGPQGVNGVLAGSGLGITFNGFQESEPSVDVADLGGSAISTPPHDLDTGTWAYGMGLLDWPGPLEFRESRIESYFQMRVAGSSAVVKDPSLAQQAVAAGLWPSVDAYIEFNPNYAFYLADTANPIGPGDYTGFVFPECSSATLLIMGLTASILRRKRPTR